MVILIFFLLTSTYAQNLEFIYEGTRNCEDFDGKVHLENIALDQIDKNVMALSGDLALGVEVPEDGYVKVIIKKCPSKAERGLCEQLPPRVVEKLCEKIQKENSDWSKFVDRLEEFKPACPIAPGKYHFEDYTVNMDSLTNMPVMQGYWIINAIGFVGGEKVMCVFTEGEFKSASK
ncbi:hypothetical protein L9F63_009331 [Diploptera punctata]|uniref:Uncharacterized protein n=1 Tax=Diploptera punctata TaxID=6984 RepID=A0AAD8AKK2_DIPPU|nr:hypothetical protein L9F63_009331 [Diploptera punctata]